MLKIAISICLSFEAFVEVGRLLILYLASNCFSQPDSSSWVGIMLRSPSKMKGRLKVFRRMFICCNLV